MKFCVKVCGNIDSVILTSTVCTSVILYLNWLGRQAKSAYARAWSSETGSCSCTAFLIKYDHSFVFVQIVSGHLLIYLYYFDWILLILFLVSHQCCWSTYYLGDLLSLTFFCWVCDCLSCLPVMSATRPAPVLWRLVSWPELSVTCTLWIADLVPWEALLSCYFNFLSFDQ